jgi:hypothetical protein
VGICAPGKNNFFDKISSIERGRNKGKMAQNKSGGQFFERLATAKVRNSFLYFFNE